MQLISLLNVSLLLVAFVACSSHSTSQAEYEDTSSEIEMKNIMAYTFGFYNVENLFDIYDDPNTGDDWFLPTADRKWDLEKYDKKIKDLAKVVDAMNNDAGGPDFLGLAEIENKKVLQDLANADKFEYNNYRVVHYDSPDPRGIDVGALYNGKKFELMSSESIYVPMPENPDVKTRDILYCKLKVKASGQLIHVYVNHWSSRRDGAEATFFKRENCAQTLLEHMNRKISRWEQKSVLIMGDLNDYPNDKSIYEVLGAKEASSTAKLINMQYANDAKGMGTYFHDGDWGCLDHIITTRNLYESAITKDAQILKEDWMLYFPKNGSPAPNKTYGGTRYYGGYSDHLPVWVSINL